MELFFRNSQNELKLVGKPKTEEEAFQMLKKYLYELNPNYKMYYCRTYVTPEGTMIYDVGSHMEFFELQGYEENLNKREEQK